MLEQYNVNENFVEGMMGHVNPSILKKNYAGFVPQKDLPALIESPVDFAGGEFGSTQTGRVNLDLLTDEQKEALASEQQTTILAEERAKQSQAAAAAAEAEAKRTSTLAAITPQQIQEAEDKSRAIEEAKIKGRQAAKLASAPTLENPEPTSFDDLSPELQEKLNKGGFDINKFLGKAAKTLGVGVAVDLASQFIREPVATAAEIGKEVLLERGLGMGPAAAVSMAMQPTELASGELTDQDRGYPMEAVRDTGFVDIDRGPEAAPATQQDQGFLTR
jgi:hypothetical protein